MNEADFVDRIADIVKANLTPCEGFTFHPVYVAESAREPMAALFREYALEEAAGRIAAAEESAKRSAEAITIYVEALGASRSVTERQDKTIASQAQSIAALTEALEPFAEFGANNTDETGWNDIGLGLSRGRIIDWFGPSDFRRARAALASPTHMNAALKDGV